MLNLQSAAVALLVSGFEAPSCGGDFGALIPITVHIPSSSEVPSLKFFTGSLDNRFTGSAQQAGDGDQENGDGLRFWFSCKLLVIRWYAYLQTIRGPAGYSQGPAEYAIRTEEVRLLAG